MRGTAGCGGRRWQAAGRPLRPRGRRAQELPEGFSLLGEEDEDEDDEEGKLVRPGGLVAVFWPVRLFRQTGQLSCLEGRGGKLRGRRGQGTPQPAAAHLLQPGHDAARVEEVVAGELPNLLTQPIVVLTHGTLEPGACGSVWASGPCPQEDPPPPQTAWSLSETRDFPSPHPQPQPVPGQKGDQRHTHVLLRDGDGGEGLDPVLVCRRGARVLKLVEELKDRRQCRSQVTCKSPRPSSSCSGTNWARPAQAGSGPHVPA